METFLFNLCDQYHTHAKLKNFSEIFRPKTFNKQSRSEWVAEGKQKTLVDNANDVLDQILKTHQVAPLTKEVSRELEKIVKRADDLIK